MRIVCTVALATLSKLVFVQ